MATVTSLTDEKIQELMAGWQGVSLSQAEINAVVSQLWANQESRAAALDAFENTVLPQLRLDLEAGANAVSDLVTNTIPDLSQTLSQHDLSLQNLNEVDIPSLQGQINSNFDWITELNEVTLPALNVQLDELNNTTLPALVTRVEAAEAAVSTIDLTGLETRLDAAEAAVAAIDLSGLETDLAANTTAINTLNVTTLPGLSSAISGNASAISSIAGMFPIDAPNIAANAIIASKIATDAVTADKIAADAVTANKIAADAVTANKIAAGSITTNKLDAQAVTAAKIATDTITANEIAANAITATEIAAGAITTAKLDAQAVTAAKIATDTITANEIAANAITATEIAAGAITTVKLDAQAVTAAKIATDTITANEIAVGAITASEIAAGAVTTIKLDAQAVTAAKIAADTITANEIAADAITATELAAGAVTAAKILANTITANEIAASTITSAQIASKTIIADNIKSNSITGAELSANVILATTRIAAVGSGGQSVELNPTGFYVYGPTSEGNPPYISFPTEGGTTGKPNVITGTLEATTLSVIGDAGTGLAATFRRTSQIEVGSFLNLNDAIMPPLAAPTVENAINEVLSAQISTGDIVGATYNSTDGKIYVAQQTGSSSNPTYSIYSYDPTANTVTALLLDAGWNTRKIMGLQLIAGTYYALFQSSTGGLYLATLSSSTWFVATSIQLATPGNTIGKVTAALGTDGTDPWVAVPDVGTGSSSALRFKRYLANLSLTNASETVTTTYNLTSYTANNYDKVRQFVVGVMDFGARKFLTSFDVWFDALGGYDRQILAFTTTGTRETNSDFTPFRTDHSNVLLWKGTSPADATGSFCSMSWIESGSGQKLRYHQYSKIKVNSVQNTYWYSSYFRSSDNAETPVSPQATLIFNSRWYPKITVGTPTSGLQARIYGGSTTAGSTNSRLQTTLASGVSSATLTAILTVTAPQVVSTFSATTPAIIQSLKTITRTMTVGTTNASANITGTGFAAWMVGKAVSGAGIPAGTTVLAYNSATSLTLSANATATAASVTMTMTMPKVEIRGDGFARITEMERLILNSTQDVNATAGNEPALRIGDITAAHMRIDANELQAMAGDTTVAPLILNQAGGSVQIGNGSNTITTMRFDNGSVTTDANGQATFAHGCGGTPNFVAAGSAASVAAPLTVTVISFGATNMTVEIRNATTNTVVANAARTIWWMAIRR